MGEEGQRERETQTPKQAPGPELPAQSPVQGLNPRALRSRPKPKSDASPTEPPQKSFSLPVDTVHFANRASSSVSLEQGRFLTSHSSSDELEALALLCLLCTCLSERISCRINVLQVKTKYQSTPKEYLRQQMQRSLINRKWYHF